MTERIEEILISWPQHLGSTLNLVTLLSPG